MKSLLEELRSGRISRRSWLRLGAALGVVGATGSGGLLGRGTPTQTVPGRGLAHDDRGSMGTVGRVDNEANGFDPHDILTDFDYGTVRRLPDGRRLREYHFVAEDKEIEVAPGVYFPAWTFNGRVPGPTLRCVEGDRIRIRFANTGSHPHTIHFHGIHPASMDGVAGVGAGEIKPGTSTVYEFDAAPFGCHLYHCHAMPLKRHIHKGLYGAFIVDPDPDKYSGEHRAIARRRNHEYEECGQVNEMVMVMNGFDTNIDGENEIYAVNTVAFAYVKDRIRIRVDQPQRLYLVNVTEFDPVNSLHLHANFFDYYDHGTTFEPTLKTVDTVMQCQGQRGILEFDFEGFEPGPYMFHAHQSEFAELGWMGFFDVRDEDDAVT